MYRKTVFIKLNKYICANMKVLGRYYRKKKKY